jgi:hypothetical protein
VSLPNPKNGPSELGQLQRWFQTVITHADGVEAGAATNEAQQLFKLKAGALEAVITSSRALTAAERLAIYANAYHTRLLECLGEVFPLLKRTLGEDGFNTLAFGYLQEYPSRSYTLNELGRHFGPYLEQTRPTVPACLAESADAQPEADAECLGKDWPGFLIDLARLEWAIYEVFDGEGVEGKALLSADQALSIPPARWAEARLKPVACLRLLETQFPVNDYYTALRRAGTDEAIALPAATPSYVALTRRDFIVRRYNLSRPEFELLNALNSGRAVGEALDAMLSASQIELATLPETLKLWFRNWTAEGFFESVHLDA